MLNPVNSKLEAAMRKYSYFRLKMESLNFRGGNPGAVQHGNFINYYQFHPPENRINILPKDIWNSDQSTEPFVGFDIGCNTGDLTALLQSFLTENLNRPCYMLGIDIDPTLIQRAQEKNSNDKIQFYCLNYMDFQMRNEVLPTYLASVGASKFNATFCFSITMWIHLNNGDLGLQTFLKHICAQSDTIVIEPQPWKCYRAAVKRMKLNNEEFPEYKNLKIRTNVENEIEDILLKEKGVSKVTETERTSWNRKILIFKIT